MKIETAFHATSTDRVAAHDSGIGGSFISARRGDVSVIIFLNGEQTRAIHEQLGRVLSERDLLAAAKAHVAAQTETK